MKRLILLSLGCLLVASVVQATPLIDTISGSGKTGANFTFNKGWDELDGAEGSQLVDLVIAEDADGACPSNLEDNKQFGSIRSWSQGRYVENGLYTMDDKGEYLRLYTTEEGEHWRYIDPATGNPAPQVNTAMPEDEDWVAKITLRYTGTACTDFAIFSKTLSFEPGTESNPEDYRLFSLVGNGSANNWSFGLGNASNSWDMAATGLDLGNDWNTLVVHYKADTQTVDAYFNDSLIVTDGTFGHGHADLKFIQFENTNTGMLVELDEVVVGQAVPEPTTLSLLALGSIFALRRKK